MSIQIFSVVGRTTIGALAVADDAIVVARDLAKSAGHLSKVLCINTKSAAVEAIADDIKARVSHTEGMSPEELAEFNQRCAAL